MQKESDNLSDPNAASSEHCSVCRDLLAHMERFFDMIDAGRKDVGPPARPRISDCGSELMTESEVIQFLRIPEVSNSKDFHNVIENLKRMHNLPRIHICGKPLYPKEAIKNWIEENTIIEK